MTKKNLRIISKPHAYLQTMTKTSLKFRKNRHKTVGGVAHTRYLQYNGDRRTDGRKDGQKDGRNAENYVPPLFFEKAGDNNVFAFHYMPLIGKKTFLTEILSNIHLYNYIKLHFHLMRIFIP